MLHCSWDPTQYSFVVQGTSLFLNQIFFYHFLKVVIQCFGSGWIRRKLCIWVRIPVKHTNLDSDPVASDIQQKIAELPKNSLGQIYKSILTLSFGNLSTWALIIFL